MQTQLALYINLDHRTDRRAEIESELTKLSIPHERLSASSHAVGAIGCTLSHIRALQRALELDVDVLWVLEDDFVILNPNMQAIVESAPDFDVFLGGFNGHCTHYQGQYARVHNSQTTSCYIVKKRFIPTLLQTFQESLECFQKDVNPHKYALDMYWKRLQPKSLWLTTPNRLGKQRKSYSDIEKRVTDYGV